MYTATLDTNVLWPSLQRDLLLSLAIEGAFRPVWSSVILQELEYHENKKLVARGVPAGEARKRAERLVETMRREFGDALVEGWEVLEGTFGLPDPDDEHVLAAAAAAGAQAIVTENLKDFPASRLPSTIRVVNVRSFVAEAIARDSSKALRALDEIARRSGRYGDQMSPTRIIEILRQRYGLTRAADLLGAALSLRDGEGRGGGS